MGKLRAMNDSAIAKFENDLKITKGHCSLFFF